MRPATGYSSLIVLALLLLTVVTAVQALEWTPGLHILAPITIVGVIVGAILASREWLPSLLAHAWGLLVGAATVAVTGTSALREYVGDPARLSELGLLTRVRELRDWFVAWLGAVARGEPVDDVTARFVFVLWMGMLLWLVSYMAAWFLVRYVNWWGAALPSGFALVASLYNAPTGFVSYLAFYLLFALLLAAQTSTALAQDRWRRAHMGAASEAGTTILRDGLIVAVGVVALAFALPTLPEGSRLGAMTASLGRGGQELGREFNRLFPNLNLPGTPGRTEGASFGRTMPLGGSIHPGRRPVFDAVVDRPVGIRYWRVAVYDVYGGTSWTRGDTMALPLDTAPPVTIQHASSLQLTQTIRPLMDDTRQLVAASVPVWFALSDGTNRPVTIEVAPVDDPLGPLSATVDVPLAAGATYLAVSTFSTAGEAELRGATGEESAAMRERYLQLPPSVTDRTREMASDLAAQSTTRYDQARAIEAALRQLAYSTTIEDPPDGRDRVDWFLFTSGEGYCDYFSSAFVVLARAAGIPSRIAAGYATGGFVPETGAYRQFEQNAHTWPEVHFPGYGWMAFEPTSNQPPIDRRRGEEGEATPTAVGGGDAEPALATRLPDAPADLDEPPSGESVPAELGSSRRLWPVAALLGLAVAAAWGGAWLAWQRPLRGLTESESAFARLMRVAVWLGLRPRTGDTPYEYGRRLAGAVPEGRAEIAAITEAFVVERFAARPRESRSDAVAAAWSSFRRRLPRTLPKLWLARLREAHARHRTPAGTSGPDGAEVARGALAAGTGRSAGRR